jgi:glyoxylase-like metal-dependent hydrolase (beta-lactamase superfamily II)/stress-induced morphogen/8-oxo-dGTP pyrophosphatase MutT (NUDIX family)
MSELPPDDQGGAEPAPRDSASAIVLLEGAAGGVQVLVGQRARRARFMPDHLAFPGGALDAVDRPGEPGALARCASRELREETGLEVPPELWVDAGERITPPIYPVRFRNRFFLAGLPRGVDPRSLAPASGENERLELSAPGEVLEAWARGEVQVPPPVLPILRALAASGAGPVPAAARAVAAANALEERAPRIEFAPDVWMLPVRTATLPPATHTNVWMPGLGRFVVVDPGSDDTAEIERLLAVIERRRGETGGRPVAVVLTHHHRDHAAGAGRVAAALGVPLGAHPATLERLAGLPREIERIAIDDRDALDLGGASLLVLHTPGHAPGHIALAWPERRCVIAGDLASGLSTILIDPDHGNMGAYLESLRRLDALGARLLPGHGPPLPAREVERILVHRRRREARILERLGEGAATLAEIARHAYVDTPDLPPALTERQSLAHLRWLERQEKVRPGDDDRTWQVAGGEPVSVRIERLLRERLRPLHLEVRDDSALHAGHRGATGEGGHYHVSVVSESFAGRTRLERHRLVNAALRDLFGKGIHALGLSTLAPSEWRAREDG